MITTDAFKDAMAAVCGPVTVITTTCDGRPFGTTVSAFWSLSLRPPMVGLALAHDSELLDRLRDTRRLGVNLLADGQQDLALNFARKGGGAKFDGVPWTADAGLPRLTAAPVWLACAIEQFVPAGDHVVLVAGRPALPLVYAQRAFGTHSGLKEQQATPADAALADGCYA
jgi:flavin reductase (DIM6/NTAB) family NADH-FMN oxidoreductase RutF